MPASDSWLDKHKQYQLEKQRFVSHIFSKLIYSWFFEACSVMCEDSTVTGWLLLEVIWNIFVINSAIVNHYRRHSFETVFIWGSECVKTLLCLAYCTTGHFVLTQHGFLWQEYIEIFSYPALQKNFFMFHTNQIVGERMKTVNKTQHLCLSCHLVCYAP
jgi:hypothetical protein